MVNLSPDWLIGEYRGDNVKTMEVEFAGTIAEGDFIKVTGVNTSGQLKVQKQDGKTTPRFVCPRGENGVSGEIHEVLLLGPIKVRINGALGAGASVAVKANEATIKANDASTNSGFSLVTSDGSQKDSGVIFFNGFGGFET